jgi:hypothetical protein
MDNNYKSITNNSNNNISTVMDRGLSMARDRGKWLKTQPVVYRWMSRAGWVDYYSSLPTSNEVMNMKVVNHKPMITLRKPSSFRVGRRSETVNKIYLLSHNHYYGK